MDNVNSLSIIEQVSVQTVGQTIQKINQFPAGGTQSIETKSRLWNHSGNSKANTVKAGCRKNTHAHGNFYRI